MKILYIGCVESSYPELKLLIEHKKNIVGVITKESSKVNADFVDLSPLAKEYNIPYKYAKDINAVEVENFVRECCPDVIYCFGWSQIINKTILDIPPMGVIGIHPADLPFNRGRHPIIWALVLGLESTASTFFVMNAEADEGDIISKKKIKIEYTDYAQDLYDKITKAECEQILAFTEALENGTCVPQKQDPSIGNVWRKRGMEDGIIDWRMSSRAIYNLVRALSHPYVGAMFQYKEEFYTVWRAEEVEDAEGKYKNIEPGKIIKYISSDDFYVKAYDNLIHVTECENFCAEEGEYIR